jgi:histidinol-phosphate aminotransferase
MSLSRRSFVRSLGVGGAGALTLPTWLNARGLEAANATGTTLTLDEPNGTIIKLDSNENPYGPVPGVMEAVLGEFKRAALYPARNEQPVRDAIAKANGLAADRVMLGSGSGEVLRLAVQAFVSPTRHLVAANPTFESPAQYARVLGLPVREVALDKDLRIDLDGMLRQVPGAGLVFLCNPNNPTGHVHSAADVTRFVESALRADPEVIVLVDEAYHEFVADPAYASALPMTARNPRVFVSRTFSKIYGIAGMRLGYALGAPATLTRMERLRLPNGIGGLTQLAALAALKDPAVIRKEAAKNREALEFTTAAFREMGFAVVASQANFVLVHIKRDATAFKEACAKESVVIGRAFPPLDQHTRISIGTLDEMKRAMPVFRKLLA